MAQQKIVFLGDSGTGKTKLLHRAVHDEFDQNSQSTIGATFYRFNKSFEIDG